MKQLAFLRFWWKLMTHMFICQVHKGELCSSFHYIKPCTLQIELQSSEKILCSRDYKFRFPCVSCSMEKHWIPACSPFLMVGSEILMHSCIKEVDLSMHVVISHVWNKESTSQVEVSPLYLYTVPFSLQVKDCFFQVCSEFLVFVRIYSLVAQWDFQCGISCLRVGLALFWRIISLH